KLSHALLPFPPGRVATHFMGSKRTFRAILRHGLNSSRAQATSTAPRRGHGIPAGQPDFHPIGWAAGPRILRRKSPVPVILSEAQRSEESAFAVTRWAKAPRMRRPKRSPVLCKRLIPCRLEGGVGVIELGCRRCRGCRCLSHRLPTLRSRRCPASSCV